MRVFTARVGSTCERCHVIAWGGERWWITLGKLLCSKCGSPMWED